MMRVEWPGLLERWIAAMLLDPEIVELLAPEVFSSRWLGFPGAPPEQIAAAEARLECTLPPSYREFLLTTNGWGYLGAFIDQVLPVEEVDWFRTHHQSMVDEKLAGASQLSASDDEYFVYGDQQSSVYYRPAYFETALQVSAVGDGVLLLNPQVQTEEGEWEAWFYAPWRPGVTRYRSFAALMIEELEIFIQSRPESDG